MSEHKPRVAPTHRSSSDPRRRKYLIGVRLDGDEYRALREAANRAGLSPAAVLRESFMRTQPGVAAASDLPGVPNRDAASPEPGKSRPEVGR